MLHIILVATVVACSYDARANSMFEPVVPDKCKEQGFCLDVDIPYPTEHVKSKLPELKDLMSGEIVDLTNTDIPPTRRDGAGDICNDENHVIIPLLVENESGDWLFLVNHPPMTQAWKVEKCVHEGVPCHSLAQLDATGHNGTCRTRRTLQTARIVDRTGKFVTDKVWIPHTCSCGE